VGRTMTKICEITAARRASKEAAQFSLKRNRRSFKDLKSSIEKLRVDPFGRIDLLLRIQKRLISRILRTERGLKILKDEHLRILALRRGRPPRGLSDALKIRAKRLSEDIERGKHLLWVWRCLGDAIPFIYHDKHALKHMLYSMEDYSVKQSAGALSGNDGRQFEARVMEGFCRRGIPAMLCDITNTLRYGDVCVMAESDPFPIEVKSSLNRNARTARQTEHLLALHAFLSTDKAENFRGTPRVERREFPMAETWVTKLDECLRMVRTKRSAIVRPEDGLTYVALKLGCDTAQLDGEVLGKYVDMLMWNVFIASESWAPYFPFTLTIRRASDLVALLEGRLGVMVAMDAHAIMRRFATLGLIATYVDHDKVALKVHRPNASVVAGVGVSFHFLRRIQFECEPIASLIAFAVQGLEHFESMASGDPSQCSQEDEQMMAEWLGMKPILPTLLGDDVAS